MSAARRILAIAGAGIAGMTAALLLQRAGFRVLLFERREKMPEEGTGIQISPNALKILRSVGLEREIQEKGFIPHSIEIGSGRTGKVITRFALGEAMRLRHNAAYTVIHRSDLAKILQEACLQHEDIELITGQKVVDFAHHARGVTVMHEGDGEISEVLVAALIGADGAWSQIRQSIEGASAPQFSNHVAWRGTLPMNIVPDSITRRSTGLWLGPNAHLVHYPLGQSDLLNLVAIAPWKGKSPPKAGWISRENGEGVVSTFVGWKSDLRFLVENASPWGGWPIYSTKNPGNFSDGPVCLVGDAAHPMVPYGAQGGAAAIEDAAILSIECKRTPQDLPSAFKRYQKVRKPRIQQVIRLSENNRKIYHMSAPLSLARNYAMRKASQGALQRRMDWLYGWDMTAELPE